MTEDKILTMPQVATLLQVTYETARGWAKTGKIPARKLGRVWRVLESDLKRFIADGNQPPPEVTP